VNEHFWQFFKAKSVFLTPANFNSFGNKILSSLLVGTRQSQSSMGCWTKNVMNQHSCPSPFSSNVLHQQLHWLTHKWGKQSEIDTLTFKTLHTGHPPYLTDLVQHRITTSLHLSSFFIFFLLQGGTPSLPIPTLRHASQAGPMRNPRNGTSVV